MKHLIVVLSCWSVCMAICYLIIYMTGMKGISCLFLGVIFGCIGANIGDMIGRLL